MTTKEEAKRRTAESRFGVITRWIGSTGLRAEAWLRLCGLRGGLVLLSVSAASGDPASAFEAMVIHPTGRYNYHENDLDFGLQKAGIPFKHYAQEDGAAILADLDRYSLVMCTPMVNLNEALDGGEAAVRTWIEKGNALVVTDACYPNQINPWLGSLVPEATLNNCACYGAETVKNLFVRDTNPPHPLRTFPERLDHESRQWLCLEVQPGWETVATCTGPAVVHPVTVLYPLGKGFVYVSSMQQRWSALAPNLRANVMLCRLGFVPVSYSLTPPAVGPGNLHLEMKGLATNQVPLVQFRLKLTTASAPSETLTPVVKPDADGRITADLRFSISVAGPAQLSLEARTPTSDWILLFDRAIDVPPSLSISRPSRSRGMVSSERRIRDVSFDVFKPGIGLNAGFNAAKVSVYDPKGTPLGGGVFQSKTNVTFVTVPVTLPKLAAGEGYRADVVVRDAFGAMEKASANFVVRAPETLPGETLIEDDNTLLVDGKPFFPIAIYHLYPDAYPQVAELGFNTVQTFQWMTRSRESLDEAQTLGLKVIFENNEKELGGHNYLPGFIGKHPALLMWYAPDEPLHEGNNKFAVDVSDIYRRGDPSHPVICVDFNPPRYALNAECSEVFGTECYIFSKEGVTPFWKAVDLIEVAHDAVQRRKPVFAVPRATGGERVDDERVVTWLALTHDVRGLFWYAWDEGDGLGLKYDASLQEGLKGILAQVRELIPALTAPVRRTFVEDEVHGMVCDDGETRTLLVINMAAEHKAVPTISEFQGLSPEPVFGETAITAPLAPLESRAYRGRIGRVSVGLSVSE